MSQTQDDGARHGPVHGRDSSSRESEFARVLSGVTSHLIERDAVLDEIPTTPSQEAVRAAIAALPGSLPAEGRGTDATINYLRDTILPGCLTAQNGPRYFGFVTGGVTPAAQIADVLGSGYDENVQVTLPGTTAATAVEARTLELVLDLLDIPRDTFQGRTITTGATASNILGLACAREFLYANLPGLPQGYHYAQDGPPSRAHSLPDPPIVILALHPHYSILKAAALVGIGAGPKSVRSVPASAEDELTFDLVALETALKLCTAEGRGVIVVHGLGEVNTGGFGGDLDKIAALCERYNAWLHVDAAFGGFAGAVPELKHLVENMKLANSLTLDGHKWLNVPYDCGLFFTRSAKSLPDLLGPVAANTPAYLASSTSSSAHGSAARPSDGLLAHDLVPSPLYVSIENSSRFRALPLLASLLSLGKEGYIEIFRRNIAFAQQVAQFIHESPHYELMNVSPGWTGESNTPIVPLNIVLFRAAGEPSSARLVATINGSRRMYVTGTSWRGIGAVRLAVSNWRSGRDGQDLRIVSDVLEKAAV